MLGKAERYRVREACWKILGIPIVTSLKREIRWRGSGKEAEENMRVIVGGEYRREMVLGLFKGYR